MGRVITNEFSWSKSRHEKFSECLRAYYLHYYRSWGGWELEAPRDVRELYVLKKLNNRFTWGGQVVHEVIKRVLTRIRRGREVSPEREIDRAHRMMQHDFRFSVSRAYWQKKYRKEFSGLAEHEYGVTIPREEWKQNWDGVKAALDWFFASRWIPIARGLRPEQWLEVDEDFEQSVFELEGVRVFAVPDFAYRDSDGTPVVVDWKTGKARAGYEDQVLGYALYLSARHGVAVDRVKASLVFLNEGAEQTVGVDEAALESFKDRFRLSVGAMRELLADPHRNVPRMEDAFPMASDPAACAWCVFRRPCGRDLAARPAPAIVPSVAVQTTLDFEEGHRGEAGSGTNVAAGAG